MKDEIISTFTGGTVTKKDLADVEFRALALIRVVEAEALDALFQARGLRVEVARGTRAASLRRGPRPGRVQRPGIGRGVGIVHDEDGVLKNDVPFSATIWCPQRKQHG